MLGVSSQQARGPKRLATSGKPTRRQELALGLDEVPAYSDEWQAEVQSWPMVLLNPKAVPPVRLPRKEELAAEPGPPPREQHIPKQQAAVPKQQALPLSEPWPREPKPKSPPPKAQGPPPPAPQSPPSPQSPPTEPELEALAGQQPKLQEQQSCENGAPAAAAEAEEASSIAAQGEEAGQEDILWCLAGDVPVAIRDCSLAIGQAIPEQLQQELQQEVQQLQHLQQQQLQEPAQWQPLLSQSPEEVEEGQPERWCPISEEEEEEWHSSEKMLPLNPPWKQPGCCVKSEDVVKPKLVPKPPSEPPPASIRQAHLKDGKQETAASTGSPAKEAMPKQLSPKVAPKDLRERMHRQLKLRSSLKQRCASAAKPTRCAKLSPQPPSEPPPKLVKEAYKNKRESQMPPPVVPQFHRRQEQKDLKKPRLVLARGRAKQQQQQQQQQQLSPKEGLPLTPKPPAGPPPWLQQEQEKKPKQQSKEEKEEDDDGGLWSLARAAFRIVDLPIHKVDFAQRSVKATFKDGGRFGDLITQLNNGTCHYENLILDVARVGKSGYLALDNRRLLCLKRSSCTTVRCRIIGVFPDRASYFKICSHADGLFRAPRVRQPEAGGWQRQRAPRYTPTRKREGKSEADDPHSDHHDAPSSSASSCSDQRSTMSSAQRPIKPIWMSIQKWKGEDKSEADVHSDHIPSSSASSCSDYQRSTTSSVQRSIKPIGMSIRKWTAVKRRRLQ